MGDQPNWLDNTNTGNPLWIDNTTTVPHTVITGPFTTGTGGINTLGNLNQSYYGASGRTLPTKGQLEDPMFLDLWERFKFMEAIGAEHITAMIECIKPYIEALEEARRVLSRPIIVSPAKQCQVLPPLAESEASPFDQE